MIRVLLFVIVLFGAALGLAWLAERPGEVFITWLGYEIHLSLTVAVVALVALLVTLALVWMLVSLVLRSPRIVGGYFAARRRDRGYFALSRGMLAIGAGDARLAARAAVEAARLLEDEPLTLLLTAQTAQLKHENADAQAVFESMLGRAETRLLGLHGLFVEARRQSEHEAARAYAEEAMGVQPGVSWAGPALLDYQAAAGEWQAALQTLAIIRREDLIPAEKAARLRSVLETAEAMEMEAGRPEEARALALAAHKRAPDLVPAAVLAARLCARLGEVRHAARIIERSWKAEPHPELATAYRAVRPGDSVRDRLLRTQSLVEIRANHREGRLALAEAAIEAREWAAAREALAADLGAPSERVCLMLADIAEGEDGDKGLARDWLARAARAARDACWVADGVVFDAWAPISPISGRLDAFQWKVPEERGGGILASDDRRAARLWRGQGEIAAVEMLSPLASAQAALTELELSALPASTLVEALPSEAARGFSHRPGNRAGTARAAGAEQDPRPERMSGMVEPARPPDDPGPEPAGVAPPREGGRFGPY